MRKFLVDCHCDTITKLMDEQKELFENDCHVDIKKLKSFDCCVQFFAIWLQSKYYSNALNQTLKYIDFYNNQISKYSEHITKVQTFNDIIKNQNENKISAVLTIEGGEALEGKLSTLDYLYSLGVRALTLTWNNDNLLAGGASGNNGLTEFGYKVVERMHSLGMIVDVSHLSEKSFWDFDRVNKLPFMASHSNVKSLCNHKRNLSDEQIKAIAKKDGVIGINLYNNFLSNTVSTVDDVINHIDYIIKLVGSDYVGFGCDFDGMKDTPKNINNISDLNIIIDKLLSKYGDEVTEKILNKNFMRLIKAVWN